MKSTNQLPALGLLIENAEVLRALSRSLIGDEHRAEDLVQDAQLIALQRPPRSSEAIGAWLRQQNGRALFEALEPTTGHAMDIVLADGSEVSVFLRDAQGTALNNLNGLSDRQVEEGGTILRNLVLDTTAEEYTYFTRPFGPATISISSASTRVLRAAAQLVAGEFADRLISEVETLRNQSTVISRTDFTRALSAAGLSGEQRSAALRVFATDVQLWAVIIEVRAGTGINDGRLISRYGGITMIRVNSRNRTSGNPMELGAFITWKEVGINDREVNLGDLY